MTSWIPYGRQKIDRDDLEAVIQVLKSDWLTTGPMVERFEKSLARRLGSRFAVVFNSGTSALHGAYYAAGVGPGDEVITSPITFVATANAALYLGATPVFVDVQADTVNIDPEKIREALSERTKVIAPVDFAGHPADMDEIMSIAESIGAVVVEDACHALGATYKGRPVGAIADMTVFSFHPVKSITSGEGGAVLTNNPVFYDRLLSFRNHGITKKPEKMWRHDGPWYYEMQHLGYSYRLSDIQCALGVSQLKKLDEFIFKRREIAQAYDSAFTSEAFIRPGRRAYTAPAWHLYPLQLKHANMRRAVVRELHRSGIGVQVHYTPIYHHPYYQKNGHTRFYCPQAERYYSRCLSLPIFPALKSHEISRIIDSVRRAVQLAMNSRG